MNFIKKITDQIDKYMHYIELQVLIYLIPAYICFLIYSMFPFGNGSGMLLVLLICYTFPYVAIFAAILLSIFIFNVLFIKKHINFSYKFPKLYKIFLYANIVIVLFTFGILLWFCIDIILSKI